MDYKFQYINETQREAIIQENSHRYLVEEQEWIDGTFLVFSDTPRTDPIDIQLRNMKTTLDILLLKQEGIL